MAHGGHADHPPNAFVMRLFTMGDNGGVGKTGLMVAVAAWFEASEIHSRCSTSKPKTRLGDR